MAVTVNAALLPHCTVNPAGGMEIAAGCSTVNVATLLVTDPNEFVTMSV